jgi:hypothetical protein
MSKAKRALRFFFLLLSIVGVGSCVAILTIDTWFFALTNPGDFDPSKTPNAPDYLLASSWAALPSTEDGADVALSELPAIQQSSAPVDVFFVHPTTWVGSQWNAPIDTPELIEATHNGATLIQASAFNACCAIYAPRYRQANGRAFTIKSSDGEQARGVAYQDVARAFQVFLTQHNKGRPFIIASHSQGTTLAFRLLQEEIAGKPIQQKLVAAYLVGAPLAEHKLKGISVCQGPTQTGCVISFNSRGPNWKKNIFDFYDLEEDKNICVNPISWETNTAEMNHEKHPGALFFDTDTPRILPKFASTMCKAGVLQTELRGQPERDVMSSILLWVMGPENYHPIEYQLFYVAIRQNANARVDAFLTQNP